jgi:hypothetical protein
MTISKILAVVPPVDTESADESAAQGSTPDTASVTDRCSTLRKLGPLVDHAFRHALAHEQSPEFSQLDAKFCDLEAHYDQLAQEVWETPPKSWSDIVERAELAYAYADEDLSDNLQSEYPPTRAAAELVMAILALTGGKPWRRHK